MITKEDNLDLKIEIIPLKKAALTLRAINHRLRQQMLQLIHQKGKIMVTDIYTNLRLEQSVASQHLAILRRVGYVTTIRKGKSIYYSVNYEKIRQIQYYTSFLLS
jgi:DNA-binding transcriptional ArsR family regulator